MKHPVLSKIFTWLGVKVPERNPKTLKPIPSVSILETFDGGFNDCDENRKLCLQDFKDLVIILKQSFHSEDRADYEDLAKERPGPSMTLYAKRAFVYNRKLRGLIKALENEVKKIEDGLPFSGHERKS